MVVGLVLVVVVEEEKPWAERRGERKGKKEDRTGQPKQKSVQGSESKLSSIQYKQFNPRPSTKHAGRPADLTHGLQPSFKKFMD